LDSSGVLTFDNAAVNAGMLKGHPAYTAAWFAFDNRTGISTPLGETRSSSQRIAAPSGLPTATGAYVVAEVRAIEPPHPAWERPVKVTFRRTGSGWKVVGLERTLSSLDAPQRSS
jgi:hypothetical protein